jgi:hypothetical protein
MLPAAPPPGETIVVLAPAGKPATLAVNEAVDPDRVTVIPTFAAGSLGKAATDELASANENCGPAGVDGPLLPQAQSKPASSIEHAELTADLERHLIWAVGYHFAGSQSRPSFIPPKSGPCEKAALRPSKSVP